MTDLTEREQDKLDEIVLDLQDEERRAEQDAAAGDDDECLGEYIGDSEEAVHCGNDCGGIYSNDGTGEYDDPVDCIHCDCCSCNSCAYARHA